LRFQMTVEQQVLEKLRELPPQKQKEVLAFVNRLQGKIWERTSAKPVRSLVGPGCEGE
jgi:phage-related protein